MIPNISEYYQELMASDPSEGWGEICEPDDPATNGYLGSGATVIDKYTVAFGTGVSPSGTNNDGAVYIMRRQSDGTWAQLQKISNQASSECFGWRIKAYGDRLIVGAPGYNSDTGRAYVFVRSSDSYALEDTLAPSASAGDWWGYSVDMDDTSAVIGAPEYGANATGAVAVFTESGGTWTQQGSNIAAPSSIINSNFGLSVAIDDVNDRLAVGWHRYNGSANQEGAVQTYSRSGSTWSADVFFRCPGTRATDDQFGSGVGMVGDLLVSAAYKTVGGYTGVGQLFLFKRLDHVAFGGTDEYTKAGDNLDFDYNDPFSLSLWFRNTAGDGYLISKMTSDPRGWGFIVHNTGILRFYMIGGSSSYRIRVESTSTSYRDGDWHHFVMTFDGNGAAGVTFYIDGVVAGSSVVEDTLGTNTTVNGAEVNLGGRTNGSDLYVGDLKHTAVYDKELSSSEILDIYNNTHVLDELSSATNLQAWWKLGGDGDANPSLLDSSGNGLTMTMVNMESGDITKGWFPSPTQVINGYAENNNDLSMYANNSFDGNYLAAKAQDHYTSLPSGNRAIHVYEYVEDRFIERRVYWPSDAEADDYFGRRQMAVGFGMAVAGAYQWDAPSYTNSGAGYVWGLLGDSFGTTVHVINNDLIAVGCGTDSEESSIDGAVYLFERQSSGRWSQLQKISAQSSNENFGWSISSYESRIIVGAPGYNYGRGQAYVFKRDSAGTYSLEDTLTTTGLAQDYYFGYSVSMNGLSAIVGGIWSSSTGAVVVYTRSDETWTQQQQIVGSDSGARWGESVSIRDTDNTFAAGGSGYNSNQGYVKIYTRSGSTWTIDSTFSNPTPQTANDYFGASVQLVGDWCVTGARGKDSGGTDRGAIYWFKRTTGTWATSPDKTVLGTVDGMGLEPAGQDSFDGFDVIGKLTESYGNRGLIQYEYGTTPTRRRTLLGRSLSDGDMYGGQFNYHYAVSQLYNLSVVGVPAREGTYVNQGSAMVFESTLENTKKYAFLEPSVPAPDRNFGRSTKVLSENLIAVGAGGYHTTSVDGSAYVYEKQYDGSWVEIQRIANQASGENFGGCLHGDADRIVIGAPRYSAGVGRSYVFRRGAGNQFTLEQTISADVSGKNGICVCLDGVSLAVSTPEYNTKQGAVTVYTRSGTTWTKQGSTITGPEANCYFGGSVSIDDVNDTLVIGAYEYNANNYGRTYLYTRSGSTWSADTPAYADDPTPQDVNDRWANAAVVVGDYMVVSTYSWDSSTYTDAGGVWLYKRTTGTWSTTPVDTWIGGEASAQAGYDRWVNAFFDGAQVITPTKVSGTRHVYLAEVQSDSIVVQRDLIPSASDLDLSVDDYGYRGVSMLGRIYVLGSIYWDDPSNDNSGAAVVFNLERVR